MATNKKLVRDVPLRKALSIPRYSAKVMRKFKGKWKLEIGVYDGRKRVGSYFRDYSTFYDTFFPFEHGGKWYALVSTDYTRTDLMALPSCKIIGGEPKVEEHGFCPVEFHVPNYIRRKSGKGTWYYDEQIDVDEWRVTKEDEASFHHFDFGFVAGCIWGDDTSWKVQHLDLSRVDEGIVTRTEKFGYVWLGPKVKLSNAVNILMFGDPKHYRICLSIEKPYYVCPGEEKDYSNFSMDD
jgi:hypothetical protein